MNTSTTTNGLLKRSQLQLFGEDGNQAAQSKGLLASTQLQLFGDTYYDGYSKRTSMMNWQWFNPRSLNGQYSTQAPVVSPSVRIAINGICRDLFRSSPVVGGAIQEKNNWGFATGWKPTFEGLDEYSKAWAKNEALPYLETVMQSPCNMGYSFNRMLYIIANEIDLGDILPMYYIDGTLKVKLISGNSIGSRMQQTTLDYSKYAGASVVDGVVINKFYTPCAYQVLAKDEEDDNVFSILNGRLIYEANEPTEYRGLSRIGKSVFNLMSQMEIEEYLIRSVRNESRNYAAIYTADGSAADWEDEGDVVTDYAGGKIKRRPRITDLGDAVFLNSTNGEKIEFLAKNNPGANTQEWMRNLEAKAVYAAGWMQDLIDPRKLDATAARALEEQVNKEIETRQETIMPFAKEFVWRALSVGMDNGDIPRNTKSDWDKWSFNLPEPFTIDSYYGAEIDNKSIEIGTKSRAEVIKRRGGNVEQTDQLILADAKRKVDGAVELMAYAKTKGVELPFERASDWLGTSRPQISPLAQQNITTGTNNG